MIGSYFLAKPVGWGGSLSWDGGRHESIAGASGVPQRGLCGPRADRVLPRRRKRLERHHRHPRHHARAGPRRHPHVALRVRGRGAARRAAPLSWYDLQERARRPAARRRQGGDRRRSETAQVAGAVPRLWALCGPAGRRLSDGRGCGRVGGRRGGGGHGHRSCARHPRGRRRRSVAAYRLRRLQGHRRGRAAQAWECRSRRHPRLCAGPRPGRRESSGGSMRTGRQP